MKALYFIRHGESEFNRSKRWAGSTDTPLTDKGHAQAKQAGQAARQQGLSFDLILSSPLARAHDTARHVAEAVGYPADKIVLLPDLIERSFGVLEGDKDVTASLAYLLDESSIDKHPDVEKLTDLQKRAEKVLNYLAGLPEDNILLVGHGAFGRALRRAVNQEPIKKRGKGYGNAELVQLI